MMLLQAFYGSRSECQLMERLEFDLLFRWFVGLGADEAVWVLPPERAPRGTMRQSQASPPNGLWG